MQGSKFVFGAIIPGTNNKGTQEDVFVVVRATAPVLASVLQYPHASQSPMPIVPLAFMQIYLHYLPIRNGMKTRDGLGLKDGVKWFTYWKGRLVVMADVTARYGLWCF